ncbi:MAG: hypothetical protein JXR95_11385 [Deltaproteobacteria bacterium]|nr:hypothetical protein [Deltaproteobacteria bacterium]
MVRSFSASKLALRMPLYSEIAFKGQGFGVLTVIIGRGEAAMNILDVNSYRSMTVIQFSTENNFEILLREHSNFPRNEKYFKNSGFESYLELRELSIPQECSILAENCAQTPAFISAGELIEGGYMERAVVNSTVIPPFTAVILEVVPASTSFTSQNRPFHRTGVLLPFAPLKKIHENMANYRYMRKQNLKEGMNLLDSEFPRWEERQISGNLECLVPFSEYDGQQQIFPFDYTIPEALEIPNNYFQCPTVPAEIHFDYTIPEALEIPNNYFQCPTVPGEINAYYGFPDFPYSEDMPSYRDGFESSIKEYMKRIKRPLPKETRDNRHITCYNQPEAIMPRVEEYLSDSMGQYAPESLKQSFFIVDTALRTGRWNYLKNFEVHPEANGMAVFNHGLLVSVRILGSKALYSRFFSSEMASVVDVIDKMVNELPSDDSMIEKLSDTLESLKKYVSDKSSYKEGTYEVRYLHENFAGTRLEYQGEFVCFHLLVQEWSEFIKLLDAYIETTEKAGKKNEGEWFE